jgi:hypothetical protein
VIRLALSDCESAGPFLVCAPRAVTEILANIAASLATGLGPLRYATLFTFSFALARSRRLYCCGGEGILNKAFTIPRVYVGDDDNEHTAKSNS